MMAIVPYPDIVCSYENRPYPRAMIKTSPPNRADTTGYDIIVTDIGSVLVKEDVYFSLPIRYAAINLISRFHFCLLHVLV